ncbi:MAG: hypothetical protein V4628_05735 [Pseudomonadota bacterium]
MKKIFIVFTVLLLVVAGGLYYVYNNLERFVKQQIEIAGTEATGTAVTVDEVVIDLGTATASVRGFRVANPEGFSEDSMISFDELQVVLDFANLSRERVGITSIIARNPHVLYELQGTLSNLDVVRARLAGNEPTTETATNTDQAIHLDIGRIDIEQISATLSSPQLSAPVGVSLGDIRLRNLSGTPDEIANQVMEPLLTQLSSNAARVLLSARAGDLRDDVLQRVDESLEAAGETLRETGATIREGLGDLFKRDNDDEGAGQPVTQ